MSKKTNVLVAALAVLSACSVAAPTPAHALVTPVALSVIPPVQLPPQGFTIAGVRASALWGDHREVYGFDFGALGNMTDVNFVGLAAAGGFNYNKGVSTVLGLQVAGIANINVNKARIVGLQVAAGVNSNVAESSVVGIQFALANLSQFTNVYGVQAGLWNKARQVYGFQIGLFNFVENLHGIQIGLLNFNTRGLFAIAPILNIGF